MDKDESDWLRLGPRDRRYITVLSDSEFKKHEEASQQECADEPENKVPVSLIRLVPFAPLVLLNPFLGLAAAAFARKMSNVGANGAQEAILTVPESLLSGVDFGPHSWERNVVYAVNPMDTKIYRPLATFHEELLLHKIAELERLLNALGAKKYSISHIRSHRRSAGAQLRFLSQEASAATEESAFYLRSWSGTSDGHAPKLPDDLAWFHREADWKTLADSRLNGSRREFSFVVQQEEDFGVDARLVASVKAAHLEVGGRYSTVEHVQLKVEGTF